MNPGKILLTAALWLLLGFSAAAAPSPWDSWRAGYTNFEQGESLRERGNYTEALRFFEAARKNYLAVRAARPDWNQRVIADRLRDCDRQISELKRLLNESRKKPSAVRKPVVVEKPEKKSDGSGNGQVPEKPVVEKTENPDPETDSAVVVVRRDELIALRKEVAALRLSNSKLNNELQRQRNFESEVAALLRDRKILEDKYALLDKRYKALEEELKRPEERIKLLEKRLVEERMNNERLAKQIVGLEQQLRIEKENARMNLAAKNALEELLIKRNDELKRSSAEIEKLTATLREIKELQEKNHELLVTIDGLNRELARRKEEIGELNKQLLGKVSLEADSKEGQKKIIELKQQIALLENQISKLNDAYKIVEKQLETSRKERDDALIALRRVQQQNHALDAEKRQLQVSLEQEKNSAKLNAVELANLRERNQVLETDVKRLFDRNADLEKRLSLRNSEDFQAAAEARNSVKKLSNDLLAAQNELIRLRAELDSAKNTIAGLERKLKAVNDENLKARAEVVAAMETEKQLRLELNKGKELAAEYEKLESNFNALSAEHRELRKRLDETKPWQAELENARVRLENYTKLRDELAKEQRLNAELKAVYNRNLNELNELRQRLKELDVLRRKVVELDALAKEVARLREMEKELIKLRQHEVELATVKVRLNEKESEYRKLEAEYNALLARVQKSESELVTLRKENAEVEKLRRTVRELHALVNSQNTELGNLHKQLEILQKNNSESLHVACRMEIDKLRKTAAEIGSLNDRIRLLQNEVARWEKTVADLRRQNDSIKREVQLKNTEIAQLQKLNHELTVMKDNSAAKLQDEVDSSRIMRLEEEIAALNKLNAELAAERDLLQSKLSGEKVTEDTPQEEAVVSGQSPEELVSAGFAAEQEGKIELAAWNYRQALAMNKNSVMANHHLGMLLFRRGDYKNASGYLEKALNAVPDDVPLALIVARCFIHTGRFGNAKAIVDPLLQRFPDNAFVQLCGALIEAGCGTPSRAEEKMLTAARLAPESAEIQIELAKLLVSSFANREEEAVIAYERALSLGHAPEPFLDSKLGSRLNKRRELVRFMSSAAREAESHGDWKSAAWYYDKILEQYNPGFVPLLAFAQWKSGNASRAKETLEFRGSDSKVSENIKAHIRNGQVILVLIALAENDHETAMRAAQMSAGANIPVEWVGVNIELEKLRKMKNPPLAVKILLKSISVKESAAK